MPAGLAEKAAHVIPPISAYPSRRATIRAKSMNRRKRMRLSALPCTLAMTFAFGTVVATTAQAQMPPDLIDKVAAIGRVSDPPNTAKIYGPLQEKEPYSGVKVAR